MHEKEKTDSSTSGGSRALRGSTARMRKRREKHRREKEITVAVNSETGTLDPAGSIALTYLSYSVTALDELLTYDENGDIEYPGGRILRGE